MKLKFRLFFFAFFLLLIGKPILAQSDLDDQINKIEDTVNKIIITADGKDYTFDGKDAEKLFKRMKSTKSQSFVWNTSDDGSNQKKIFILDDDGNKEVFEIVGDDDVFIVKSDDDFEWNSDGMQKKVKVKIENDEKKVTVTTKENGEEKTEIYEGDEADEYLEKMNSYDDDLDIIIEKDDSKKIKKIIIETEKEVE